MNDETKDGLWFGVSLAGRWNSSLASDCIDCMEAEAHHLLMPIL